MGQWVFRLQKWSCSKDGIEAALTSGLVQSACWACLGGHLQNI